MSGRFTRREIRLGSLAILFALMLLVEPVVTARSGAHGLPPRGIASQTGRGLRGVGKQAQQRLSAATTVLAYPAPPVQARAALLMDMRTQQILYAKNADARLPMASTTKITTAIVVLMHARLNEMATVSEKAATIGESTMALRKGERLTVKQLLYGLMLNSGNDAAITLAEHVAGSETRFVGMMNGLARLLGMRNTHYVTSHGLDAPGHYTSARDLARVSLFAMGNPVFRRIVRTESYHIRGTRHNQEHWLANINRVMYWFPHVDGVKPGDTDAAGLCQVVSAWRGGRHLLAVLLNTPTLVYDVRNLLDYGGRDFSWVPDPAAYWDSPANVLQGGAESSRWIYYFGAGHYIRGGFLRYFESHGGLETLGYPRTDEIVQRGRVVQYFEGGELVANGGRTSVRAAKLGRWAMRLWRLPKPERRPAVVHGFLGTYVRFGGQKVLGRPVTGPIMLHGHTAQLYEYGAIVQMLGGAMLAPLGDVALRERGWLPASGAGDVYPPTLGGSLVGVLDR